MDGFTDKKHLIAWFIKQCLENAFREAGLASVTRKAEDTNVRVIPENGNTDNKSPALTANQTSIISQALMSLTLKLPSFLYNAGITNTIISPSKIHAKFHSHFLEVTIEDVGLFILDIKQNKFHARVWSKTGIKGGEPMELDEVRIKGYTNKHNLDVSFNYNSSINRDIAYLTKKLEEYIDKSIPKSKLSERKSDLFKYKNLVKHLPETNEAYKALFKEPVWKGVINSSPASAIRDIATAEQGKGHLPGVDLLPGGKQLLDILADDPMLQWDLERVDMAQRTPAGVKDEFGASLGGYQTLIAQMKVYNNNEWGNKFIGFYAHPETLDMMKSIGIETASVPFSDNFMNMPYDHEKKVPFEFFVYVNSAALKHEYLDLKKVGVIYVNPATE